MRLVRMLAVGMIASAAVPASAEVMPLAEAAKLFGARESGWSPELSPSGKKMLFLVPGPGAQSVLKVADLQSKKIASVLAADGNPENFDWCDFASETRIICQYGGNAPYDSLILSFSRLVSLRTDGTDLKQLGQKSSGFDTEIRQFDGSIVDWLPDQPGSILMARNYVPQYYQGAASGKDGVGVDRIDLETMKVVPVEPAKDKVSHYYSDGRGHVRVMAMDQTADGGLLTGFTKFRYRPEASRDWKDLGEYDSRGGGGMYPIAVDQKSNSVFFYETVDGRDALFRMTLDGSGTKTLIAKNDKVDIGGIVRLDNGHPIIGYQYTDDKTHTVYFDPGYQKLAASLGRALPETPLIYFASASADEKTLLVHASSDTDPGAYYLLDRTTRKMEPVLLSRNQLEGHQLAPVQSINFPAADGTMIPAYLTIAAGLAPKKLPAIVLPHGGPSSRDVWGFDWLAQFFAARGYAVIQPNYRGSDGYGDNFLGENAFKDWRKAMSDIGDASRYLVDKGIADPGKLAIVGWSYGGYAALQEATLEPTRYKAVVAIAPVTDLGALKREAEGFTSVRLTKQFIGSGEHIKAGSPLQNAAQIKAPVLLVHGDLDNNVRIEHSLKMANALKKAGTPVELLRYKQLEHQLDDSNARTEMLTKIGQLLDRTIGQ
jgi:dipeptidyl aminopeptidase/acylaminoacyl peptidase